MYKVKVVNPFFIKGILKSDRKIDPKLFNKNELEEIVCIMQESYWELKKEHNELLNTLEKEENDYET